MKVSVELTQNDMSELNSFNSVGEKNWRNEFFNSSFPNSFLVVAREEPDNNLSGTQGFIEYKINYFGLKKIAFRSERTLLSSACRGKGVFKKQIAIGKAEIESRGGMFCFGSTDALKPFAAAGFEIFEGYRTYDLNSFSLFETSFLSFKILMKYLTSHLARIFLRKFEISELYNFLILKSLMSYARLNKILRSGGLKKSEIIKIELIEFETIDAEATKELSNHFNHRSDAVYLWLDAAFFARLALNYPTLNYLKVEVENEGTCHFILEKLYNGYFKIVMCSDYNLYNIALKSNKKVFRTAGIYGLLAIRNTLRVPAQNSLGKTTGFSRMNGYGRLVFIDFADLSLADLELEDIWLML